MILGVTALRIHLPAIAMLVTLLVSQKQDLPDAFYQIPESVREQATLVVTGSYSEGRSPCILRPDGTRAWTMESELQITKVYRGKAGKTIYLNWGSKLEGKPIKEMLTPGHKYLVLLRPNDESLQAIEAGKYVRAWDALTDDEILAIVELR